MSDLTGASTINSTGGCETSSGTVSATTAGGGGSAIESSSKLGPVGRMEVEDSATKARQ